MAGPNWLIFKETMGDTGIEKSIFFFFKIWIFEVF